MNQTPPSEQSPITDASTSPLRLRPPRRWVALLLSVCIFAGGTVVGSAVTAWRISCRWEQRWKHPEKIPARITARLTDRLDLTDAQATQVEEIFANRQEALMAIRRQVWPQIRAEFDRTEQEVASVLDEQQAKIWPEVYREMRERWKRRRARRHGHRSGSNVGSNSD